MTNNITIKDFTRRNLENSTNKFQKAKVCVLGLGGLGSNVANMLARSSIGHLHLIDFDIVELSNLNRQIYSITDVGKYKTDAIKSIIKNINPFVNVVTENLLVDINNIISLIKDDDIIIEAFDYAELKALIVNEIMEKFPEKYVISASGMAGIGDINEIKTRKINHYFYICGDEYTDFNDYSGMMAPRVINCASHQANKVLQIIMENF